MSDEFKQPFTVEEILGWIDENDYVEVLLPSGALGDNMLKVWGTIQKSDVQKSMSKAKNGIFPIRAKKAYWGDRPMGQFLKIRIPDAPKQIPEDMMDKKLAQSVKNVDDELKVETSGTGGVAGYMLPMGMKGPGKDPSKFVTQNQGYKILQPNAKRTRVYETEKLDESFYFNSSISPEQKVEIALNEIRSAMIQTERLIRHTMKLKQEDNQGSSLYSEKTRRSLKRISERAIRLMSMLETLK